MPTRRMPWSGASCRGRGDDVRRGRPRRSVVVVIGTVVVEVDRVVVVLLEVVVLDGAAPEVVVVVVFGLETVVVVAGRVVGGAPAVVVVVGSARGTGGPIPLERAGGFVVGTGTVGTVVVGTGTCQAWRARGGCAGRRRGGRRRGGCRRGGHRRGGHRRGGYRRGGYSGGRCGGAYLGTVVVGGAYLGAVVAVGVEVGDAVVAVRGGLVVELVDPVGGPGTSACAVRVIEPKSRLSLAFSASRLVSRCIWTASSCLSAAIAAVSPAVDGILGQRRRRLSEYGLRGAFDVLPRLCRVVLSQVTAGVLEVDLDLGLVCWSGPAAVQHSKGPPRPLLQQPK